MMEKHSLDQFFSTKQKGNRVPKREIGGEAELEAEAVIKEDQGKEIHVEEVEVGRKEAGNMTDEIQEGIKSTKRRMYPNKKNGIQSGVGLDGKEKISTVLVLMGVRDNVEEN
mmetsp:Transcript_34021/g.44928  ORF Transcript_34021/g.44928 Transcript_34021/m.44928 type:complete len:112 (-) Transcript_34021:96-431(-)